MGTGAKNSATTATTTGTTAVKAAPNSAGKSTMASQHVFRIGDPVWAKMKGFSPWPGKVCMPPSDVKRPAIKKLMHCVSFFGTGDYAWIEESNMKPYEEFKETLIKDKKSKAMEKALGEI